MTVVGLQFANQIAETRVYKIWNKNSNLIESVAILTITTGQLVSKLTNREPSFLPKITYIVFECTGILALPIAIKIFSKTWEDWRLATDWGGQLSTTTKLFYQGIGILSTTIHVTGTALRVFGYSEATKALFSKIRFLSMVALAMQIGTYLSNLTLLDDLRHTTRLITQIRATDKAILSMDFCKLIKEKDINVHSGLATEVKQLLNKEMQTAFEEYVEEPAVKHYDAILASLKERKRQIQIELTFIPICYAAQWVSTANKETTKDFAARWTVSALWTGENVRQKLFLRKLQRQLQK